MWKYVLLGLMLVTLIISFLSEKIAIKLKKEKWNIPIKIIALTLMVTLGFIAISIS